MKYAARGASAADAADLLAELRGWVADFPPAPQTGGGRLSWAHPWWLLVLLALPALWLGRGGAGLRYPRAGELGGGRSWLGALPGLLRTLALAALVLALARPRTVGGVLEEHGSGIPIVVALDVSSSMLAQDFQPRDRLEVAKETTARFIAGRPDDPIGLVAFAGEALTLVPVTTYDPILLNALKSLRVGLLADGTAMGDGLAIAVDRVRRVPGRDRVVVLLSDGESNRGLVEPTAAAQAAAAFGVRVYTIGVGSRGTAPVPVERDSAGLRYAPSAVGLDEALLQRIAALTGGEYFRATDAQALRTIFQRIDRLVHVPVESRRRILYREWYLPLLLLAAAALAAEWLLKASRWGVVP